MEDKICIINQPAGFGDIFFTQKIVKTYIDKGYKVIYPVLSQILHIKDYIKTEGLEFVDVDSMFPYRSLYGGFNIVEMNDHVYLPITFANMRVGGSVMEAKYKMVNLDYSDWAKYFNFERNKEKEDHLYYNILGLKDDEEYTLTNNKYGTQPNFITKDIYIENNNKIVEINFIKNYSIFDWCKVIENASEISIVDSSINYIIEKLNLKANKLFLTSRFTPSNFSHIINLFKTNWIYK